jgi:hypothetical protein
MAHFSNLNAIPLDPIQKLTKRSMDNIQIIDVKLEAHADCACGCTATKEMCKLENKVLNPDICQCECEQQKDCTIPFQVNLKFKVYIFFWGGGGSLFVLYD